MERKNTSFWLNILVSVMLILVIPFGVYYFFYVSSRKTDLTNRNFRLLADLGKQLKLTVENYSNNVLKNAANNVKNFSVKLNHQTDLNNQKLNDLRAEFKKNGISLSQNVTVSIKRKDSEWRIIDSRDSDKNKGPRTYHVSKGQKQLNIYDIESPIELVPNLELTEDPLITTEAESIFEVSLHPKQEGETFGLYFECKGSKVGFSVKGDLKKLIGPIGQNVFDDVLVVEEGGGVIFQQNPWELRVTKLDSLVDKEGKKIELSVTNQSSGLFDVKLAGTNYKLFLQPVQISLPAKTKMGTQTAPAPAQASSALPASEPAKTEAGIVKWAVCGLVQSDQFRSESLAISYMPLIVFISLFLIVVLSWPFLRVWYMGPKERLGVTNVFSLAFSILMGSALLTFLLLDAYTYICLQEQMDDQLQDFAENIRNNFDIELKAVYSQLEDLNKKVPPNEKPRVKVLTDPITIYPYFENVLWADKNGKVLTSWTVYDTSSAVKDISTREYFKNVKEGRLWSRELKEGNNSNKVHFRLQSLISRGTGKNLAIFAMPPQDSEKWTAAIMSTQFLSLFQTVVPPGFGYCVIEDDGNVLFHSDENRNLRENFFAECDNNRRLRSAMFGRAKEWINAQYLGKGHRLYVTPMKDLPWFLVVFRDKGILETATFEMLTISMVLFIVYFIPYGILLILLNLVYFLHSGYRAEWVWPDKNRTGGYFQLIAVYLLISAIFFIRILTSQPFEVLSTAFLLPPFGIVLTYLKLKKGVPYPKWMRNLAYLILGLIPVVLIRLSILTGRNLWYTLFQCMVLILIGVFLLHPKVSGFFQRRSWPTFRVGYVLAAFLLLVLIAMLPSCAFFRIAYDNEIELFIKHGQLNLARALEERKERLEIEYLKIKVLNREEFLDKRLGLNQLDIYQSSFFKISLESNNSSSAKEKGGREKLKGYLAKIRPLYNQAAVETHELIYDKSADESFEWTPQNDGLGFSKKRYSGESSLRIHSVLPTLNVLKDKTWLVGLVIGLVFVLIALFLLVYFIAQSIFLLDVEDEPVAVHGDEEDLKASWATCSTDEKLALFDLAQDGFINSKNPGFRQLLRKRLIVRAPGLRLINESFRRFVISAGRAEDIAAREREGAGSRWNTLKGPLLIGLIGGALFLFISQRELLNITTAFISAIAAGMMALLKLLDVFQRDKTKNI
ncbi:cache domain-containing protein [Candidatus Poribacteria bacterium]|nr:cache domain-containing protein [Candidatus Poribacteria bacterium]